MKPMVRENAFRKTGIFLNEQSGRYQFAVRLDKRTRTKILSYAEAEDISIAAAIRRCIVCLLGE